MRRRVTSVLAILALLFTQLAVSAFACPQLAPASAPEAQADAAHCGFLVTPNICESHCQYGDSNVNHALPDAAPDVLAMPLPWRASPSTAYIPLGRAIVAAAPRSHSPPPLDLFGVRRI